MRRPYRVSTVHLSMRNLIKGQWREKDKSREREINQERDSPIKKTPVVTRGKWVG